LKEIFELNSALVEQNNSRFFL